MKVVFYMCVLVVLLQTTPTNAQLSRIRNSIQKYLKFSNIPDEFLGVAAALQKALNILKCLPLNKRGRCYTPDTYCVVQTRKVTLEVKLTICKYPWQLQIDFKLPRDLRKIVPKLVWKFVFLKVAPIIFTLDHRKADGVTKLVSTSRLATFGFKVLGLHLGAAKAYINFNLMVRWDCRRPSGIANTPTRLKYNTLYNDGRPGNDMNKLYYKLSIGYELRVKKLSCWCYKAIKRETLVSKQGHFFEGPTSCKSDWSAWKPKWCSFYQACDGVYRTRTCVGRSTGGPPCRGVASVQCPPPWRIRRKNKNAQCP